MAPNYCHLYRNFPMPLGQCPLPAHGSDDMLFAETSIGGEFFETLA